MTRTVNTNLLNALYEGGDPTGDLKDIEPYYAVEMQFEGGTLRIWTGVGDITISGNTYQGTGDLLEITGLEETGDLTATGTTLTLSGLDSSILSYALTNEYQGRLCKIFWGIKGVTTIGGNAVCEVFSGFMDRMTILDEGETSSISMTVESRLITLERPNVRRYTDQSHQAVIATEGYSSSDDTFFKWVADLGDKSIPWGRSTVDD